MTVASTWRLSAIPYLLLFLATLCACASSHHHDEDPKIGPTSMIYSPNGEPLNGGPLGRPACAEAMGHWFDRLDGQHAGTITHDEFMADAKIQFQRMDMDKNHYLVSAELEKFRLPYRQQSSVETSSPNKSDDSTQSGQHRRGRGGSSSGSGASESSSNDVEDPVMAADTNNDFKVTWDEFRTNAEKQFTMLDVDHNGLISRERVLKLCAKSGK